jgi:hypothetical protein
MVNVGATQRRNDREHAAYSLRSSQWYAAIEVFPHHSFAAADCVRAEVRVCDVFR